MIAYAVYWKNGKFKIRPVCAAGIDDSGPILAGRVVLRPKAFLTVKEAKAYVAEQETRKQQATDPQATLIPSVMAGELPPTGNGLQHTQTGPQCR